VTAHFTEFDAVFHPIFNDRCSHIRCAALRCALLSCASENKKRFYQRSAAARCVNATAEIHWVAISRAATRGTATRCAAARSVSVNGPLFYGNLNSNQRALFRGAKSRRRVRPASLPCHRARSFTCRFFPSFKLSTSARNPRTPLFSCTNSNYCYAARGQSSSGHPAEVCVRGSTSYAVDAWL